MSKSKRSSNAEEVKGFVKLSREAGEILDKLPGNCSKIYQRLLRETTYNGKTAGNASFSHRFLGLELRIARVDIARCLTRLKESGLLDVIKTEPLTIARICHWGSSASSSETSSKATSTASSKATSTASSTSSSDLKEGERRCIEGIEGKKEEALNPDDVIGVWPEPGSPIRLSKNQELRLEAQLGPGRLGYLACALEAWLKLDTPAARKARERPCHFDTIVNWDRRERAKGLVWVERPGDRQFPSGYYPVRDAERLMQIPRPEIHQ